LSYKVRQPVVVVLGHVDSGKTSLLDKIRGTAVQAREIGGMTQHIGASFFPIETLKEICGSLLQKMGGTMALPGLLVIDTPGHEVFTNLRSRGGSAADISVLVVDATSGFEIQTYESIDILKRRKVPFIVALNKLDRISGWKSFLKTELTSSIKNQDKRIVDELDNRVYETIGHLSRLGFRSEIFYRIDDFSKEIAIVPVSAKTGDGIPELIAVLVGLAQQYLSKKLTTTEGAARGIVLEVKEETGLGQTANLILLDGKLQIGDTVIMAKRDGVFTNRIKAILLPKPLDEMRDPRDKFVPVKKVQAAAGVKIITPDLDGVLAGSPLFGVDNESKIEELKKTVESEVSSIFVNTDKEGLIIKSDTLGSLEAIIEILRQKKLPIRLADIGPVTRRDIVEAAAVRENDKFLGVILAFGVKILPDAQSEIVRRNLKFFSEPIIYDIIQNYINWVDDEKDRDARSEFSKLTPPCSLKIIKGLIFRNSNPAIVGVEILTGRLKQKSRIINSNGKIVGTIHQIQDKGKNIELAYAGSQIAASMNEPTIGRHIFEDQILYTLPNEHEIKILLAKYLSRLDESERKILEKIMEARRLESPLYGY